MFDLSELKALLGEYPLLKAVLGHGWGDSKIVAISLAAFILFGALFVLASRLQKRDAAQTSLVSGIFPPEHFKSIDTRIDLIVFALNKVLWVPAVVAITSFLIVEASASVLLESVFGDRARQQAQSIPALIVQILAGYLSVEFAFYWVHRLMHTNKFLWGFHRCHHSGEVLTFLTGERNHPVEILLQIAAAALMSGTAMAAALYVTGVTMHPALPFALFLVAIGVEFLDKLHHSHFRISFGPLNYLFVSSRMHQIHHSAESRHRDRNFGGTTSLFDCVFGSLYIPKSDEEFRLGLNDVELGPQNPHRKAKDFYVEPFVFAWRALAKPRNAAL